MSGSSKDVHKLLKELESKIEELPIHIYIMIWAITEMTQRMTINERNPKFAEICYPFTSVPLFSPEESKSLEELWLKNIKGNQELFPEPSKKQSGGRPKLSFAEMKKKAAEMGQSVDFVFKSIDPKKISPDYLYDYTTEFMDTVDAKVTEASGNFGVIALENTMPDPRIIIPTVPPILLPVPGRSIFPIINAILEALRITNSVVFYIDPLGIGGFHRNVLTLIMVCLDLARGNIYHAIFTAFGFIGNNPMFVGIALKILRDSIMLISPDIRTDLRDILFKSSKSFVTGFSIWIFTTMSPGFVRQPIANLFTSVSTALDNVNNKLELTEKNLANSPIGKLANIRLPRIPTDKIPDVNNLYALREALREPAIYCDPKVSVLIEELRNVPPYALFFDLALIPRQDSKEYPEMCKPYEGGNLTDNLIKQLEPEIDLKTPELPQVPQVPQLPQLPQVPQIPSLNSLKSQALANVPTVNSLKSQALANVPTANSIKSQALGSVPSANSVKAQALGSVQSVKNPITPNITRRKNTLKAQRV